MTPLAEIYCTMRRRVALGKLHVFEEECWRLAELVRIGTLNKRDTVDMLQSAAEANGLPHIFGDDLITKLMADAFAEPAAEDVEAA